MAISSAVDICNRALNNLSLNVIDSLDASNDRAVACNNLYEDRVRTLMSEHDWRFLVNKVQLLRSTDEPVNEWTYYYDLPSPSEMVGAPIAVFDSSAVGAAPVKDWERFGNFIATNYTALYLDYRQYKAISYWPYYFTNLVILSMTAWLAPILTEDTDKLSYWSRMAHGNPDEGARGGYHRTARNLDSQGEPNQSILDFSLISARAGSGR